MGKKVKKTLSGAGGSILGALTGVPGLAAAQLLKKKPTSVAASQTDAQNLAPKADPANDALRAAQGLKPVGVPQPNMRTPAQILEEQRKRRTLLGGSTGQL